MKKILLILLVFLFTLVGKSQFQTFIGPEIKQEKRAIEYFQLGKSGDYFYTISRTTAGKGLTFYLEKYKESTLELVQRYPFQLPTEDMAGIRWAKLINDKILLLFQDVDKSAKTTIIGTSIGRNWKFFITGMYLSLDGQVLGQPVQLSKAGANVEISPDSKYLLFMTSEWDETKPKNADGYNTPEKAIFSLYKSNNLQPVVERELDLIKNKTESVTELNNLKLNNSGVLYYISRRYIPGKQLESSYSANKFDLIGNVSSEIKINTKGYIFYSLTAALYDNKYKLIGYYYTYNNNLKVDKDKDEYYPVDENIKGTYSADVDFTKTTLLNEQYSQETENGKEKYFKTTYGPAKKLSFYLRSPEHIYFNSDGSYYLVSQISAFHRGIFYMRRTVNYWGFDLIVSKYNSNGVVEWSKDIPFFSANTNEGIPDRYQSLHVNDKIYILRSDDQKNWKNYYEKKSITTHDFELSSQGSRECVFIIDAIDKSGNISTQKLDHNPKKIVKWAYPFVFLGGIIYQTNVRYLTQYDNNIILLTENEDKDKLEFVKVILK